MPAAQDGTLGILVGAANDEMPDHLVQGLSACDELKEEIEAFTDVAMSGKAV